MNQQNKNTSAESELKLEPYSLKWDNSNYKLFYNGDEIGEGMLPPEIIVEFVRLMNCAYKNGYDYGYARGMSSKRDYLQTEFDF